MNKNIYFDGTDWIHISQDICLVYPEKIENFEKFCNSNIELFTKNYYPKSGDIVMDVGSGVGAEICIFSKAVGELGHVYAIEADINLHLKNLKVVDLLKLKNVTCINSAIMDKNGTVDIGVFSLDGIDSSIYKKGSNNIISVKSQSIDEVIKTFNIDKIDYIKTI